MRLRKGLPIVFAAALGVAVVVLPAIASSETPPSIVATNHTVGKEVTHSWSPATATVGADGEVTISNPSSETPHGVEWVGGPGTPTCEGVPVGDSIAASGTNWHGSCKFPAAGVYTFYCTVHGAEMTAAVTVNADGTTTVTSSTGQSGSTSQPPAGAPGSQPEAPTPGAAGPGQAQTPASGRVAVVKLARAQHGQVIRGSLQVAPAGAGGGLEVTLFARRASLASSAGSVRVGRLVRASVSAGTAHYAVALDARARRALRARGHLALTVRIVLAPRHRAPVTFTRVVSVSA